MVEEMQIAGVGAGVEVPVVEGTSRAMYEVGMGEAIDLRTILGEAPEVDHSNSMQEGEGFNMMAVLMLQCDNNTSSLHRKIRIHHNTPAHIVIQPSRVRP